MIDLLPTPKGARVTTMRATPTERFFSKVTPSGDCLLWDALTDPEGYGLFWFEGRNWRAHRFAYYLKTGETPGVVMHLCDNPACVRAAHLQGGTQLDNQRDKARKGRAARGEVNGGGGKLTEAEVLEIKRRLSLGESQHSIALDFPCSRSTVCAIKSGRLWSWTR